MKQYKGAIIVLSCCIFVILVSGTFLVSHAAYSKASSKTIIFNGPVIGSYFDLRVDNIYIDNTEVNQMPLGSEGYILNTTTSYCTSFGYPQQSGWLAQMTDDGEVTSTVVRRGQRCTLYYETPPVAYWFTSSSNTFSTGTATGHNVYIKQVGNEKSICVTTNVYAEACISQPYTQYGLSGHTPNNSFSTTQRQNGSAALVAAIPAFGTTSACTSSGSYIRCAKNKLGVPVTMGASGALTATVTCQISNTGLLQCSLTGTGMVTTQDLCKLTVDGTATCSSMSV